MSNFSGKYEVDFEKVLGHLKQDLQSIRTGRATPVIVEPIIVDAYGTPTPLIQLASISCPEPTQLFIQPWDSNLIKSIEKAIQASSLGIMPVVQGVSIRLNFPPLTEERRKELIKTMSEKLEKAKIATRNVREVSQKSIKQSERGGEISEDQAKVELKLLQDKVDKINEAIQDFGKQKERDLITI
ncbi:MAG: ribosome recycling factor [Candidatus Kerfeldbacteria bacterium CG08_land_8_20_14_0_20_43_14]|uniref:Ribosome-recycling factor n=1 Tax=Candidatus Kerfeldbacteria bacterium CG08_land_8_20_14_0_20_43_14 TaxID=2014246 RepID=A0A2H0YQW3_9BACT|nr:MAG: ribosome recycling factor [Candidatus Kerfeldbacteria bacterium CG08_land_8_20_14_0_20_43_14]